MRLHGEEIRGVNIEEIIIPRGNGKQDIVLLAQAVLDMDEFDRLVKPPKPRVSRGRGNKTIEHTDAPDYKAAMIEYGRKRLAYMVLKSLEATPGLEWETVDMGNPDTWLGYEDELTKAGFSIAEQNRVTHGVLAANGLDEKKVDEARKRFLASREAEALSDPSSLMDEPLDMESGELVSVSE